jgi:uncharacterized membrane protein (DUF373 family)
VKKDAIHMRIVIEVALIAMARRSLLKSPMPCLA